MFSTQVAGDAVLEAVGGVPADDADRPTLPISISDCGRWPPPPPMAAAESTAEPSVSLGEVAEEGNAKIGQVLLALTLILTPTLTPTLTTLNLHPNPKQVLSSVAEGLKRARDAEGAEATPGAGGQAAAPAAASKMARWDAIPGLSDDDSDDDD